MVTLVFPAFLVWHIALAFILHVVGISTGIVVVVAIASFIAYFIGFAYSQKFRESFSILDKLTPKWEGSKFSKAFWSAQEDLLAFLALILTIILLIR